MNFVPGFQKNGNIVDIYGNIITSEEKEQIIDTVNDLPVNSFATEIVDAVSDSIITVISAETGSGKTTQVPKMLMKKGSGPKTKIAVAEPRVIATIGAANRVSKELLSFTGDPEFSLGHKVGYRTGKEVLSTQKSELLFVTDGLQLLRQYVTGISPDILIIDEVHTFSVSTEFLLSQARQTMQRSRRKIKLVLMSATMDIDHVADFFRPITENIPVFDIPGRTFPVSKEFKEGYDFIPSILSLAKENKNILVFVEGKKEIDQTIANLEKFLPHYDILPLHSELPILDRNRVLNKGEKPTIIVATNIAQESITIDYINAVVDNGYCKVLRVNSVGVPELHREPISKADTLQRAGRAGRVQKGEYVRASDISFDELNEFPEGEIENITLEKFILIALSIGFDPYKELKSKKNAFVHAPDKKLVEISYDNLRKIGALSKDNEVTRLGRELLNYPLEPNIGKMLREGARDGCSLNMVDICAIINQKGFLSKIDTWKNFVKGSSKQKSDLIAQRELFNLLITRDKLSKDLINKFRQYGVDKFQLNLFQEYADNGKEKMLFEVVDFECIGVKQKRIYEILETIKTLKERLEGNGYELKESNDDDLVVRSILAGMLNNIFVWNKKAKMFFNKIKGGFKKPITSTITPSEKFYYVGNPFVIGGGENEDDMPLLSFVTKVDEVDIDELGHEFMQEEFSDITFGVKTVGRTNKGRRKLEPHIVANMQKDIGGISLTNVVGEIPKEKLDVVIAFSWLPDFLIENNVAIKKYINSRTSVRGGSKFNIDRFREILRIFTPKLKDRFYLDNIPKTLDGYKYDSSLIEEFYNSNIPCVVEFRKNPLKESYIEKLFIPKIRRKNDILVESKPTKEVKTVNENQTSRLKRARKSKNKKLIGSMKLKIYISHVLKISRNSAQLLIGNGLIKVNGSIASHSTIVDKSKDDIEILDGASRLIEKQEVHEKRKQNGENKRKTGERGRTSKRYTGEKVPRKKKKQQQKEDS